MGFNAINPSATLHYRGVGTQGGSPSSKGIQTATDPQRLPGQVGDFVAPFTLPPTPDIPEWVGFRGDAAQLSATIEGGVTVDMTPVTAAINSVSAKIPAAPVLADAAATIGAINTTIGTVNTTAGQVKANTDEIKTETAAIHGHVESIEGTLGGIETTLGEVVDNTTAIIAGVNDIQSQLVGPDDEEILDGLIKGLEGEGLLP